MDTLTPEKRSERMSRVRCKDTKPEFTVRRMLHAAGYRYRLHRRDLPGSPDLVFPRQKKVIFVHGCFWHRHPGCPNCRLPKSKLDFWKPKLEANRVRDLRNHQRLRKLGWSYLIIWECEVRDKEDLARRVATFMEEPHAVD